MQRTTVPTRSPGIPDSSEWLSGSASERRRTAPVPVGRGQRAGSLVIHGWAGPVPDLHVTVDVRTVSAPPATLMSRSPNVSAAPAHDGLMARERHTITYDLGVERGQLSSVATRFAGIRLPNRDLKHDAVLADSVSCGLAARLLHSADALALSLKDAQGVAAYLLLRNVLDRIARPRRAATTDGLRPAQATALERLIRHNMDARLTLRQLAQAADLPAAAFTRAFQDHAGVPPYAYLAWVRIDRAVRLLFDTRFRASEIAFVCGFDSTAQLDASMQDVLGITPDRVRALRLKPCVAPVREAMSDQPVIGRVQMMTAPQEYIA